MLKGKHAFGPRGFGPWLFNVTEVDPNNPGDARPLQDFSKKELDQWCNKHNVLHDLPINKETETLPNIIDAVLRHYKETGVLKAILLPFINEESDLQQPHEIMYPLDEINLNYGPDGKGGQRNPKPRHILQMMRKFDINLLVVGMARKNPHTGEVFVNEGQQRGVTGGILGLEKLCYQCLISDDPTMDPRSYKSENTGKLQQSPVETYEADAVIIKNDITKQGKDYKQISLSSVLKLLKLNKDSDEYIHFKIKRYLDWERSHAITMVNSNAKAQERFAQGVCSNYNQMFDIFETKEYIKNQDRIIISALNFYQEIWSKRAMITGDLILFLEFFYWNQWFYDLDNEEQQFFLIRMKNALLPIWPDNPTSTKGAGNKAIWNLIQDARKEYYPNITLADKNKNGIYHSSSSPRVAQCMWIGTAIYQVLKDRLEPADADRLVEPYIELDDGTKLTYNRLKLV